MEREQLVNALIVIVVLFVLFVGFFSLFPETKQKIEKFTSGFLSSSFVKSDEEIRQTVKLVAESLDSCSVLLGKGCACDIEMDIIPGDNTVILDNRGEESKFILVEESQKVDATWNLGGRKIGMPIVYFDGNSVNLYCKFDNQVLTYDSAWHSRTVDSAGNARNIKKLYSTDGVSKYAVVKMEDGNFCFVNEQLLGFEIGNGDVKAGSPRGFYGYETDSVAGLVKIGSLPEVEGTFSDYYSGKEFFSRLPKCTADGSR